MRVGRGGQQHSVAVGGQGGGQPARQEGRKARPQPQGPVLPSPTGPWVLQGLSRGLCHRETLQSCH